MLRKRPLVFVSSTIEELRLPRAEIEAAVRSLGMVDEWLFEFHAVSAGAAPDVQYLNVAANCDLFVLVIGQEMSVPTREEYERGFGDNPQKVLAFYVGPTNDDVKAFRSLIDSRHSRTEVTTAADLADAVAKAVQSAALDGRLVLPDLRRAYREQLARLDRLVDLQPPLAFVPFLDVPERGLHERPQVLWGMQPRLAVLGIGGSGKTYAALTTLDGLMNDGFTIPLYLRVSSRLTSVSALVEAAFDSVRFQPGQELIERYGREGRLALCVDGLDDLTSAARQQLLNELSLYADRFPRARILVLARSLESESLGQFTRCEPGRLDETTLGQLFALQGFDGFRVDRDVPKRILDLVERPFWAALLATVGLDVGTGLVLLERLLDRRLQAVVLHEEARRLKLRYVLGHLALHARPALELTLNDALSAVADVWLDERIAALFADEPAESLIEEARATGLIDAEAERLLFVHPLVATMLAAEAAVGRSALPVDVDDELAAFIAALLPEERRSELVALLEGRDVFTLARALRLRPSTDRQSAFAADAERYGETLRRLAPTAGNQTEAGFSFLRDASWMAVRPRNDSAVELAEGSFEDWSTPTAGECSLVLWPEMPFASEIPEFVAAGEALYMFKRRADRVLAKAEPAWPHDETAVERLLDDEDLLSDTAVEFFSRWRDALRARADELGLAESPALSLPSGEPQLTLYRRENHALVHLAWGATASFSVAEDADLAYPIYDLARILNEPDVEAREWLRSQVEEALGSDLDSASWLRPELLAAWVW